MVRLTRAKRLAVQQVAPDALPEIKRADLDAEPVSDIIKHLKCTGRLLLTGNPSAEQESLFQEESLA